MFTECHNALLKVILCGSFFPLMVIWSHYFLRNTRCEKIISRRHQKVKLDHYFIVPAVVWFSACRLVEEEFWFSTSHHG